MTHTVNWETFQIKIMNMFFILIDWRLNLHLRNETGEVESVTLHQNGQDYICKKIED